MKGSNRKFFQGIVNHCYQKTVNGNLLFYSISDYLVCFSVFCVVAKRYPGIRVLKLCLMPDHIHQSVIAENHQILSDFERDFLSCFIRELDKGAYGYGARMHSPFGSVPKVGDKKARTNFIYLDNNPVERKLVDRAEQYRWNFLAYASSNHPFSKKLILRESSLPLRKAVSQVKSRVSRNLPLNHALLHNMALALNQKEREQLIDYIIASYSVLDYQYVLRFFDGDYEQMLLAIHSTTGSEHDINERFTGKTDAVYAKMTRLVLRRLSIQDIHRVLPYSQDQKKELFAFLLKNVPQAHPKQVAAFLHMAVERI